MSSYLIALHDAIKLIMQFSFLVCIWFFSIDASTEVYEEGYEFDTLEDRPCSSSVDLPGKPLSLLAHLYSCSRLIVLVVSQNLYAWLMFEP